MNDALADQLFEQYSAGRTPKNTDFNASRMFSLLEDAFGIWCGFHAPSKDAISEVNRYESLKVRTERHTRDNWIHDHFATAQFISASSDVERFRATLRAMCEGTPVIVNAALWNLPQQMFGSVNLLQRVDDGVGSIFGPYHYQVVQFKRAHDLKEHYALQVCMLNQILGTIQQYLPPTCRVELKGRTIDVVQAEHQERLQQEIAFFRAIADGRARPEAHKPPKAAQSPWRQYANRFVKETKDLQMLPHLNIEMRQCLKIYDMFTTDDVARAGLAKVQSILEEPYASDAYYTSVAYYHNQPVLRAPGHFPTPVKKYNLYFDFEATETFNKDNSSFVYLIGIWDKEENKYVPFIARTPKDELSIFEQFYDYVKDFDNTALYHWTEYEAKKMGQLAQAHPEAAAKLNKLISCCVDLKVAVNDAFYLPSPSFSLKAAAPSFGFSWRQNDCGAMDSMVFFTQWLKSGKEELLNKILTYNEDDCKAMLFLEDKLKAAKVWSDK